MTYKATTTNSEATQTLAGQLARQLRGGETIELASDLGGGKTTFVQGLMRGLGYSGEVTSPTFTLSQVYRLQSGLEVHHYDLYRLHESGVVGDELEEDVLDPRIIVVIEWAGIVEHELPGDRLRIEIEAVAENERILSFQSGGPKSEQLIAGLTA
jgi:tRNA threonylcarbamoyladenosine biosynthesis protein TsaE